MKLVNINDKRKEEKKDESSLKAHLSGLLKALEEYHDQEVMSVSVVIESVDMGPIWACSNVEDLVQTLGALEIVKMQILSSAVE